MVENRIDEIIESTKDEIAILFCNLDILERKETKSILKFLKNKTRSNILIRVLFPLDVEESIINSYREVANVRIFDRKIKSNNIIIASDYIKVLVTSITDPPAHDNETAYFVTYVDNENIAYVQITTFEKL